MIVKVTKVYCQDCEDERRPKASRLGTLYSTPNGTAARWYATDTYRRSAMKRRGWPAPWHAIALIVGDGEDPEQLHGFCDRHGTGYLDTADVASASGKVTLRLQAPRR